VPVVHPPLEGVLGATKGPVRPIAQAWGEDPSVPVVDEGREVPAGRHAVDRSSMDAPPGDVRYRAGPTESPGGAGRSRRTLFVISAG
jgi:hypothetical protein